MEPRSSILRLCYFYLAVSLSWFFVWTDCLHLRKGNGRHGSSRSQTTITVKNVGTSASQTVNTDMSGRYSVPDLGIGTYEVTAMKSGFRTAVRSGIALTVEALPVVDFQLALGQTTESVDVSAETSPRLKQQAPPYLLW